MQTIPANEKLVGMKIVPKGRFSARDRQRNNEKLSAKFFVNCYKCTIYYVNLAMSVVTSINLYTGVAHL